MPVYLSRWTGSGTRQAPYEVLGAAQAESAGVNIPGTSQPTAVIDLRPVDDSGAVLAGHEHDWAMLRTGSAISTSNQTVQIADGLDDPVQTGRLTQLANQLGVNLDPRNTTVRTLLIELMTLDGGVGKWKVLAPGTRSLYLGEQISI